MTCTSCRTHSSRLETETRRTEWIYGIPEGTTARSNNKIVMNHTSNSNIKYLVASGFSFLAEAQIVNWEGDHVSIIDRKAGIH